MSSPHLTASLQGFNIGLIMTELSPDQKGAASLTLGEVIVQTRTNFPDPRFHPIVLSESGQSHRYGIDTQGFTSWLNADGIGTKPEFAERLFSEDGDPSHFETLAFDTFAMIESDVARNGQILLGIAHIIDTNTAENADVISALARGTKKACDEGRFPLLNGETAELGYRSSGYGRTRVNWNAVGLSITVPNKFISGERLKPGQPIVALRETSLRSNGLTKARKILETNYVYRRGFPTLEEYTMDVLSEFVAECTGKYNFQLPRSLTMDFFNHLLGHNFFEQVLIPWHKDFPEVAEEILKPSTLYGKLIYEAQGGVYKDKLVDITGAAHISGGGVPEKGKRMVEDQGLGLHIHSPFPDPKGVKMLMNLARGLPDKGKKLIDERSAYQQWNRGIGFMVATSTLADADTFVKLAGDMGYEAAMAGEVVEAQVIALNNYVWRY